MEFGEFDALKQRRVACREELRVNRELAPAIALRARAIVPASGSYAFAGDGAGDAVEYAIEMRRFDNARTMESLALRGVLTGSQVTEVAQRLAAFHASAPRFSPPDRVAAVMRATRRNVRDLLALTSKDAARRVGAAARFRDRFLLTQGREIAARADAGFIRDGYCDLRAAHVVFDEQLAIVGRHEFDARLREIDVKHVVDQIADWLDARQSVVCSPE